MPEITIRLLKGAALSQTEMDNNLRSFHNSASIDVANGDLSLFTSESSDRIKTLDVNPAWFNHSGSESTGTTSVTGSLIVTDTITAQEFNTEFVSSSIIFQSGSTKFGDDVADVHSFTGSLALSGSQAISGSITLELTGSNVAEVDSGFVILREVSESLNYANDTAAATGGVPLGGLYRNGNFIQIRLT